MKLYDIDESKGYPVPVIVEDPLGEYYRQDEVDANIAALRTENDALHRTITMCYESDMRAIKMWQKAHPGNDLKWPDHKSLVVWLLERIYAFGSVLSSIMRDLPSHRDWLDPDLEKESKDLLSIFRDKVAR